MHCTSVWAQSTIKWWRVTTCDSKPLLLARLTVYTSHIWQQLYLCAVMCVCACDRVSRKPQSNHSHSAVTGAAVIPSADTPSQAEVMPCTAGLSSMEQPHQTVQLPPAKPLSSPPCPRVCVHVCVWTHKGKRYNLALVGDKVEESV